MLLILTIGLVAVGAVALVIGFVSQATAPIYISIVCSVLAGLVLLVFSRMSRRQPTVAVGAPPAADASGPATTEFVLQEARTAARGTTATDGDFPIEDYDQLLVSEIVPLLPELDLEELDTVRAREESGKARASILRRIDGLAAELEQGGGVATAVRTRDEDEDDAADDQYAAEADETAAGDDDDDDFFPIADYDELRVAQIVPLLPELDDDELEMVADRERAGAARASILIRIDELLGIEPAPVKRPAPKKAPAKKTAAKKAPAKKTAAAKKAPAKKAAAAKKTTAKKTPAKKTAAKKAPAKKAR